MVLIKIYKNVKLEITIEQIKLIKRLYQEVKFTQWVDHPSLHHNEDVLN